MKKINFWKIIWCVGIYLILGIILYLVILYKVEWENKDLNTYLYFYDCNNDLCTSTSKVNNYYSKMMCDDNICPYVIDILNKNVILSSNDRLWIYNYIDNRVVNNQYINYKYIGNDFFIVKNENNKQGIIDLSGNIIFEPKYDMIDDYKNGYISYQNNNLYGIDSNDESLYSIDAEYEKIILINDKMFAGMKNNLYKIYSYENVNLVGENQYNYVYVYKDIILVINNKKIDILSDNLKSTLLMKIDTFYEYSIEKERDSLNIIVDDENIYFDVFLEDEKVVKYKYNILNKKLV